VKPRPNLRHPQVPTPANCKLFMNPCHTCRCRHILGARKIFAWSSSNLPENFSGNSLCDCFLLHMSWRPLGKTSRKKAHFQIFCPDFHGFCPYFRQIKLLGVRLHPRPQHHWPLLRHTLYSIIHEKVKWKANYGHTIPSWSAQFVLQSNVKSLFWVDLDQKKYNCY